ncbi:MAG: hypothetical protein HY204_03525 [Nitrospirae bacterium]|nr:hypothetical protein [Nitrospirota bacterium]
MKEVIVYTLLIFGAPIAVGGLISLLFYFVLELIVGESWKKLPQSMMEIIDGIFYAAMAVIMFKVFSVNLSFAVPVILALVCAIWLGVRREYTVIPWQILGIIISWALYLAMTASDF